MKYPEAVVDLFKILEIRDRDTGLHKSKGRVEALQDWLYKYLHNVEETQLTISNKQFNLENHDFICNKITHDCIDDIISKDLVKFTIDDHRYTANMWILKNYRDISPIKPKKK